MGFNIYIACNYLEQKVKRKATRMFNQWKEELKAIRIEYTQKLKNLENNTKHCWEKRSKIFY
ncbi:MAG: hypothetical protein RMJ38_05460 [candidate division WOR-3 bacterium]|nr:hypothetical protein [candidate division WOR-3 bacterium]MDW8150869.1 hypothetical protein [candidate division WOR-3 bacterium]